MHKSFSILSAGALALALTACVEPETRPSGSGYVSLDDLVGMRARNNDSVLQSRGFTNTGGYKSDVVDRWYADLKGPGVPWLPRDILETEGAEEFLRQATNERRNEKGIWEMISSETGNHHWDVWIYARAIADMVVGGDWDCRNWPWIVRREEATGGGGQGTGEEEFAAR